MPVLAFLASERRGRKKYPAKSAIAAADMVVTASGPSLMTCGLQENRRPHYKVCVIKAQLNAHILRRTVTSLVQLSADVAAALATIPSLYCKS